MQPDDTEKCREIVLHPLPPGQVEQALRVLGTVTGLRALPGPGDLTITVEYCVVHHTLEAIEACLVDSGLHLDNSLMSKLRRAVVRYVEDVQRANLVAPEVLTKGREAFAKVYELHPHGDRDETPEEWRQYR